MTVCTICGHACPGMPDFPTSFCAECYLLNLAGNPFEPGGVIVHEPTAPVTPPVLPRHIRQAMRSVEEARERMQASVGRGQESRHG